MKHFTWQTIEYIDGSNPYICKTEREFKRIKEKYTLRKTGDNHWIAIEDIYYLVYGFVDKNKNATFVKRYKTRSSAMSVIQNMLKEDKFKQIVLKIEKRYLNKNNNWDFSSIEPEPHL
ncbi:hypothetical protein IMSAG049_00251 [Clostridiales bacterium]|nr:hypothetical protein IMSAG049_00251 [Clostridiales bacterium]